MKCLPCQRAALGIAHWHPPASRPATLFAFLWLQQGGSCHITSSGVVRAHRLAVLRARRVGGTARSSVQNNVGKAQRSIGPQARRGGSRVPLVITWNKAGSEDAIVDALEDIAARLLLKLYHLR